MSTREWLDQAVSLCKHGQPSFHQLLHGFAASRIRIYKERTLLSRIIHLPLQNQNLLSSFTHNNSTMCHYQPISFECPACHNVVSRGGEERECKDYIQTRDREMARMHRWREGSRERAPPTPFIFGWCQKYGSTEKDPVTVVSGRPCESCLGTRWNGDSARPSPSDSEASVGFARDGWLSPGVQAPLTPLTSIEDELDRDKMELDFPMPPGKVSPSWNVDRVIDIFSCRIQGATGTPI